MGAIRPNILQKAGVAGVMRLAGVGPLSATAKSVAGIQVAESIVAGPLCIPISEEDTPIVNAEHFIEGSFPNEIKAGATLKFAQLLRKTTKVMDHKYGVKLNFFITTILHSNLKKILTDHYR